jgi:hypothetical protein
VNVEGSTPFARFLSFYFTTIYETFAARHFIRFLATADPERSVKLSSIDLSYSVFFRHTASQLEAAAQDFGSLG